MCIKFSSKYVSIFILLLLSIKLCYPIFRNEMVASLPGDTFYYIYEANWFCSNFPTDLINEELYAPRGVNMSTGYHMPFILSVGCIFKKLGPVVMFNILTFLQVSLILLISYLVSTKFVKSTYLRIFFVLMYSFSSFFWARISGHTDILSTIWATPLIFYLFYDLDFTKLNRVVISFVFLAICMISCWQNIPNLFLFVFILLIPSFIKFRKLSRTYINLLIAVLVSFVLFFTFTFPILDNTLNQKVEKNYFSNYIYNSDLISYIIPIGKSVLGNIKFILIDNIVKTRIYGYFELYNSIDLIILFIFLLSYFYKKNDKFYFISSIIIFIYLFLSFGPYLSIGGIKILDLKYYEYLMKLPPFSISRTPARYSVIVLFLVYIYVARFIDSINFKNKNIIVLCLFLYSILCLYFYSPNLNIPYFNYFNYFPIKGLNIIAKDNTEGLVLNIPLATHGDDASQNFMFLYHKKDLVSGTISYASQNSTVFKSIENNSVLTNMGCSTDRYKFVGSKNSDIFPSSFKNVLYDENEFTNQLVNSDIQYIIINKNKLKSKDCFDLNTYINNTFLGFNNNFEKIDENENYSIFKINYEKSYRKSTQHEYLFGLSSGWGGINDFDKSRWLVKNEVYIDLFNFSSGTYKFKIKFNSLKSGLSSRIFMMLNNKISTIDVNDEMIINGTIDLEINNNRITFINENCYKPINYNINGDSTCYYPRISGFSLIKLN